MLNKMLFVQKVYIMSKPAQECEGGGGGEKCQRQELDI